jgi:DNA-binding Lrp family transcriptional regulator
MEQIDRDILNIIQTGFPVDVHPYAVIGEKVGLSEEEAYKRVTGMKEREVIRRIGATFDSRKLSFTSTLCAAKVPQERIEEIAAIVGTYPEVTHNYERKHIYNLWFTLIAESTERIEQILAEICEKAGIDEIRNMPAIKMFKIKVDFKFKEKKEVAP